MSDDPKEVKEAPPQPGSDAVVAAPARDGSQVDDTYKTLQQAQKDEEEKNDPKRQLATIVKAASDGAVEGLNKSAGAPGDIAGHPAVRQNIASGRPRDASAVVKAGGIEFSPVKDSVAASIGIGDAPAERARKVGDVKGRPGDNSVREIDKAKDNPEAVQKRYESMVDGLKLPQAEKDRLKAQYGQDLAKVQEKYKDKPDDLERIMRSSNLMMDKDNLLNNDRDRVNAASGLMARGADNRTANRQGENPTCALTSESRIEQQNNFAKYADEMGSIVKNGGAWRGGENGQPKVWVDINKPETNGANFTADAESKRMYDPSFHQAGGKRDILGQLDNAKIGQEYAIYDGMNKANNPDKFVYVSANAHMVPGADAYGQGASRGTYLEKTGSGNLKQVRELVNSRTGETAPADIPPTSLDNVARVNYANGGGGLMVQENMAREFMRNGRLPAGMHTFTDANDLKAKLAANPGREFQVATNGIKVLRGENAQAMPGEEHGLHAQAVSLNDKGDLVWGNNWSDKHNNKVYSDDFVNAFTNPDNFKNYTPRNVKPDGSPDWREERVGPTIERSSPRESDKMQSDREDAKKKDDKEKEEDKAKKEKANKEKEEEEKKKQEDREKRRSQANAEFNQAMDQWLANKAAAEKEGRPFTEGKPQLRMD